MTSFTVLGSSSGLPQANRATAGYLLKTDNSLTLFDCGGGVTGSFLKRGENPLLVDRIFISHTHPDHVCELPLFIQLVYLRGRAEPLELYLPEEFIEPFRAYLKAVYIIEEKLPFEIRFIPLTDGTEINTGEFTTRAIGNSHLKGYADYIEKLHLPNKTQCHSFKITVAGKKLFYSADIGSFDDVKAHMVGCDVVVLESTHLDVNEFFSFVSQSQVAQFVLTHLGDEAQVKELHQMAEKYGVHNIITAVDGLEVGL